MLVVFAPQIPLYGVAVVLYGVLQAHRRFAAPALAPLVSSLVVIVAYLAFVPLGGGDRGPGRPCPGRPESRSRSAPRSACSPSSLTVIGPGRAAAAAAGGPPCASRTAWPGRYGGWPLAGLSALLAQQAAMRRRDPAGQPADRRRGAGRLQLRLGDLPGAVRGARRADRHQRVPRAVRPGATGRPAGFAALSAQTTRAVVLVSGLAAGVLAAAPRPGRRSVPRRDRRRRAAGRVRRAIALFAPGLVGYGLMAHLSRVLYAAGAGRARGPGDGDGLARRPRRPDRARPVLPRRVEAGRARARADGRHDRGRDGLLASPCCAARGARRP